MKIEQTFTVAAPAERVWEFITDLKQVAPCVPGLEKVESISETKYKASVKVAVGPIKTRFNVDVEITEQSKPVHLLSVTRGEEGGRASMLSTRNELRLKDLGDGSTEVYYSSDVSVTGRLGKFGLGIMKKKAKSLGDEFAENLRNKIEATP